MKVINASAHIIGNPDGDSILKHIEWCGRVCYQSRDQITDDSAADFVRKLIACGHESVLEHASLSVDFIVDRGISHQIVRHRIASYSQESTRRSYADEITVIEPCYLQDTTNAYDAWLFGCMDAEKRYQEMIECGAKPEEARAVLPNSMATELIMTANLREWRHFLRLRTDTAAHPQMREVAIPLAREMQAAVPVVFDDIVERIK